MSKYFDVKGLREERGQIVQRQNEIGDKIKAESRCVTPEEKDELVKLQARNVELKSQIESGELLGNIESVEQPHEDRQLQTISMKSGTRRTSPRDQEMALRAWALKSGGKSSSITSSMRDAAHRCGCDLDAGAFALSTPSAVGGDDSQPENDSLMRNIEAVVKTYGEMLEAVDTIKTDNGNPLPMLIYDDTATLAATMPGPRSDDLATRATTSTAIAPVKKYLGAYGVDTGVFPVPCELFEDYAFPLSSMLGEACGLRIARKQNALLTQGRGSAYNEFNGLVPSLTSASQTDTYVFSEGVTTGPELYDLLVQTKFKVDRYYRNQPKSGFMFSDSTLGTLTSAVDAYGRPLFQISKNEIVCGSLNERFWINNDLADISSTSDLAIIYGDFSAYKYRQVRTAELVILREVFRQEFNAFGVMMVSRGDALLQNPKALFGVKNHVVTSGG